MNCPRCASANPEGALHCGGCGAGLGLDCATCGTHAPAGFRFCGQCGAALTAAPTAEAEGPASPATERRQLTVLFCDLVGSTPLAERLDPEDLRDVMAGYHEVCEEATSRFGGHLAQYLGDGVVVYFGYPQALEDAAERALRAALEIQEGLVLLNRRLVQRGLPAVQARAGAHTGSVVVGEMESGGRRDLQATGDTMNVAARLEALAGPGTVVTSEDTLRLVPGLFVVEDLGTPALRGVSELRHVYRVMRPSGARGRQRSDASLVTPLAGRKKELAELEKRWDEVRQGRGQVVLVKGEAGIGKSRLLYELRQRLDGEPGTTWLTCHCSSQHPHTALFPVAELAARSFGLDQVDAASEKLAMLEANVAELGLDRELAVPLLADLLQLPVDAAPTDSNPEQQRRDTLRLLVHLVRLLAQRGPTVFVAEDLHWADPTTLEFLGRVVTELASEPTLVLLSSRPDFQPPWPPPPHQSTLELAGLNEAEAEELVSSWALSSDLPPEIRDTIVARTDGVPLFLEELTKAIVGKGSADGVRPTTIPTTLRDSLAARLDAQGQARETAQLAAVLGRSFDVRVLEAAASLDARTLETHLDRLVAAGLLVTHRDERAARYTFRHALIREAAYESMLKTRRRQHHGVVAGVLETQFPEVGRQTPETLAHHCEEAGRVADAATLYRRAAERSASRWAYTEATEGFRKALAMVLAQEDSIERDEQEFDLLRVLTPPLMATRGYANPELPVIFERTRELMRRLGDRVDYFRVLQDIWGFHCVHADRAESIEAATELLALSQQSGRETLEAIGNYAYGATAFYSGDHERAREFLGRTVEYHRCHDDRADRGGMADLPFLGALALGWSSVEAGRTGEGWTLLEETMDFANRLGDPFAVAQALPHLATAANHLGREVDEIRAYGEQCIAISQKQRLIQTLLSGQAHVGWAKAQAGDAKGIDDMRAAIAGIRGIGTLNPLGTFIAILADALLALEDYDQALDAADESIREARSGLCAHHEPLAHLYRARALLARGERGEAEHALRTGHDLAETKGARLFQLLNAAELARLLRDEGAAREGLDLLAKSLVGLDDGGGGRFIGEARTLLEVLSPGGATVESGR